MFSFIPYNSGFYPYFTPFIPTNCDKPPTIYEILNSIVNGDKNEEDYSKIKDLAKLGRKTIFNFDYPLSNKVSQETFETTILNHYMMRRIGYDTVTAFRISLSAKLEEIMPIYNKMFDALDDWNIFSDGETTVRSGTDNTENQSNNTLDNTSTTNTISDRRNSETPQSQLQNVRDGKYVTNYSYDTSENKDVSNSTGQANSTNKNTYEERISRSPSDKIAIYKEMQENIKSIYSLIFNDLDDLFYNLL